MPISNYPSGFASGLTVRGLPLTQLHPGEVFWVNSTTVLPVGGTSPSDGNKGTYQQPFSTITKALTACTADRGDIIAVMPGYTENIATAAAEVWNVAGVAIVGLGTGSLRPKLSFTAAAATHTITAANMSFHNIGWEANFADVAIGLDVSAVDGLSFENCHFTEAGTDLNFVHVIDLATGADDISFKGCTSIGNDASNDSFINGVAHDGFYMDDCTIMNNTAQTAAVGQVATSGNATNVVIKDCRFRSNVDGALHIDLNGAACSGFVSNCHFSSLDVAGAVAGAVDFTGGHVFNSLVSGEADLSGITVHGPYVDA